MEWQEFFRKHYGRSDLSAVIASDPISGAPQYRTLEKEEVSQDVIDQPTLRTEGEFSLLEAINDWMACFAQGITPNGAIAHLTLRNEAYDVATCIAKKAHVVFNKFADALAESGDPDKAISRVGADEIENAKRWLTKARQLLQFAMQDVLDYYSDTALEKIDPAGRDILESERWTAEEASEAAGRLARIDKLESDLNELQSLPRQTSRCFIATAACGEQSPEVAVLRRFRDQLLLTNKCGTWAVAVYTRLSPPVASIMARSPALRSVVRQAIVRPLAALAIAFLEGRGRRYTR